MIKTELIYPKIDKSINNQKKPLRSVRYCKNKELKIRFQTLIFNKGMSEKEFRDKIGVSRQIWYYISWGVWDCKDSMKIKIAMALNTDSRVIWPTS